MKHLLREPLLHFVVLGAAIFAAFSLVSRHSTGEPGKIVITQGQLASMWDSFTTTRQRTPTRDEWEGLIRARVREETYYREALALSLDKDDAIIRRRLQQKMEFVSNDIAAQASPTDAELTTYLQAHADRFRVEPRISFGQVYLNPERHGANLERDAEQLLVKLNTSAGTRFAALGDPLMLDHDFTALQASEIARQFGDAFAAKVGELQPGRWQGPVESAFGVHIVLVRERKEGRVPALADVRDAVHREWDDDRRLEAKEQAYQQMLKRYTVTIENPEPASATLASRRVK